MVVLLAVRGLYRGPGRYLLYDVQHDIMLATNGFSNPHSVEGNPVRDAGCQRHQFQIISLSNIDGVDADAMGQGFIDANPAFYGKDSPTMPPSGGRPPSLIFISDAPGSVLRRPGEIGDSGMS